MLLTFKKLYDTVPRMKKYVILALFLSIFLVPGFSNAAGGGGGIILPILPIPEITLSKHETHHDLVTYLPLSNVKIGSWNLTGSSVEDVSLTRFSFDIDEVVGTSFNEEDISNLYLVLKDTNGNVYQSTVLPI